MTETMETALAAEVLRLREVISRASATASAAVNGTANHLVALGEVLEILKEGLRHEQD